MKRFVILILAAFALLSVQSQTLKGRITDTDGKNIENVSIGTLNLSRPVGTISGRDGNYTLKLKAGVKYTVRYSCIGYADFDTVVTFKSGETKIINVSMKHSSTDLDQIEIKGDNSREEGITRINPEDAKISVGVNQGVENTIKSQEGVSSNNELSSQYSVRGGNFDENLVYVNDIEIFRPLLIRNGQQEGLSFINTDMISDIRFSSGGFDAKYGDKMSSVLDIKYRKPQERFSGSASLSLLGATAHLEGLIGSRMTYQIGFRNKSTGYLLKSLDTEGEYNSDFNDLQAYITYDMNEKTEIAFLGNISDNNYKFIPQTRQTQFGSIYTSMNLKVYFDGQEQDRFTSLFGALMLTHAPQKDIQLKFIASAFNTSEKETYDIQGQYWLYETGGLGSEDEFDRGIGTYLEHARNKLNADIMNLEHKGYKYYNNGFLSWGVKYQYERINDKIREWKMVDSADYTVPSNPDAIGQYDPVTPPLLQNYYNSDHDISSSRITGFVQRQFRLYKDYGTYYVNIGARGQYWTYNKEFFPSPRASVSLKPQTKADILLRFATGIYAQFPFYREFRNEQGVLNTDIKSQKSLHFVLSSDWNFKMLDRPFKLTTAAYYKHLWDLIPYRLDNVRIRYSADNNAVGYAAGIDMKLFGEFIKGIDSWITLSLMQTKQDIEDDGQGYIPRPTDQLFNVSVSFQDYLPNMPWMRVYLNFNYGSGYPYYPPTGNFVFRMPHYLRADMAFTFRLKDEQSGWAQANFMKNIKKIWLNLEWLNVFGNKNVISYMYVQDYAGASFAVPDYLTPTRLNARLTFEF
ncbi:MAG: TonB-dependent receptor [Bacteroidales bacterium]|nr:TonB-dependent receptor [Bacteroidales bacterium]